MFFKIEKAVQRTKELKTYIYKDRNAINNWFFKEDGTKQILHPPKFDGSWTPINPGDQWRGLDAYFWFQTEFHVPNFKENEKFALIFDFGNTSPSNLSGFESLLFIDGKPYQGIDQNHQETFLDFSKHSGKKITLAFKAWSGLDIDSEYKIQNHLFNFADYAWLDEETKNLYYLASNIIETVKILGESVPVVPFYTKILNHAFNYIDYTKLGSETFYQSIAKARSYLDKKISSVPKESLVEVAAIGHTHIDVAWLWQLKHTREKAARSFSTVLKLMDEYPEYIFLQTQPQIYEYIKEDYPEIYSEIQKRVAEGRWEVDGAMWLEADCNIPSGESLVRQIMLGKQFIKEEFDKESTYLWLPDVFGYSWALPQILKKSGIKTFMTTKISWSQYNQLPHDTFNWRGIDGSEILTHVITTPEPEYWGEVRFNRRYTYNGKMQPITVKGIYDNYHDKEVNQKLLLAYGHGDGGGGVDRTMLENRRQMEKISGLPKVCTSRADDFFKDLHDVFNNTKEYVHLWDGELYLEYHRGTYTSQAKNKKYNRKLELSLRNAEIINTSMLLFKQQRYPAKELKEIWKVLARNQFHDIIPGSSIKEVYEDSDIEYHRAMECVDSLTPIDLKNNKVISFNNTSNWMRSEWVKLPKKYKNFTLTNEFNEEINTINTSEGEYVFIENVPALGNKKYLLKEMKNQQDSELATQKYCTEYETDFYVIKWLKTGEIISIFDKQADREVLSENHFGNQLLLFEDKPLDFDAWDIDIYYQEKVENIRASQMEILTFDNQLLEVEFMYKFNKSSITQKMILFRNSRRIDFKTKVNWQERQSLLKVAFPVDVRSTEATYDIQYGNVTRPTHWNTSWDMAKFEMVGHQWADLSEYNYGVSLMNDCKYGYDIKDNILRLTLLKGAIYPDPEADLGEHEFTYSLFPHLSNLIEGGTVQEAWGLNDPLLIGDDNTLGKLFTIDERNYILIDAIKESENKKGIIIRFHDYSGGRQVIGLTSEFAYKKCYETNLMEEIEKEIDPTVINLAPFEVKTIYFEL